MLDGKASRGGFVSPDVTRTLISVWPFHAALVGGDAVDTTGIEGDFVDSWTAGEQGMGLGLPTVISQHRINFQVGQGHP